jgi:hypothetical protein
MKDTQKIRHSITLTLSATDLQRFRSLAIRECRSLSSLIIFLLTREADTSLDPPLVAPVDKNDDAETDDDIIEEDDNHPHPLMGERAAEDLARFKKAKKGKR